MSSAGDGRSLTGQRWTLVALLCLALVVALPRALTFGQVADENTQLKERLDEMDSRMEEVEQALLRLRAYEAHLRSLTPDGDHGPLPPTHSSSARSEGVPSTVRAEGLSARADTFLRLFSELEPSLNDKLVMAEELSALESALPSVWPASGELTSPFGWRRSPFGTRWRFHSGVDIARRRGVPIVAVAAGTVASAGWDGGFGKAVVIDHGLGISSIYAHCHRLDVAVGDEVEPGQRLGSMGSTGRTTGPHLHFELHFDGVPVDPLDYLPAR